MTSQFHEFFFLIEFLAGFWFLAQLCVKQRIGRHSRSFNKGIEPSFHGTRSINISKQHHSANTVGRVQSSGPQGLILMNDFCMYCQVDELQIANYELKNFREF